MVLFLASGFALSHFLGWTAALPVAAVLGLVAARLVPQSGRCAASSSEEASADMSERQEAAAPSGKR